MADFRLAAETRTEFGKGSARRTRRAGRIPAVLYGHGQDVIHLSLPAREFAAALRNGGSAWAWVCGVLGFSWPEFFAAAESVPDAGGAVFRPFLTGERGGVAGSEDRAGWDGLGAGTTRGHLARAAVEGVARAVGSAAALLDAPDDGAPSPEPPDA